MLTINFVAFLLVESGSVSCFGDPAARRRTQADDLDSVQEYSLGAFDRKAAFSQKFLSKNCLSGRSCICSFR